VVFNHQFQGISQRIVGHNGDHISLHEFLGRLTLGRFTHHIDLSNRGWQFPCFPRGMISKALPRG
jgi:hypothetical protein